MNDSAAPMRPGLPTVFAVAVVAGALAFLFLRRARGLSAGAWILWLFGAFNLCIVG